MITAGTRTVWPREGRPGGRRVSAVRGRPVTLAVRVVRPVRAVVLALPHRTTLDFNSFACDLIPRFVGVCGSS